MKKSLICMLFAWIFANVSAQNPIDRHSSDVQDAWVSCQMTNNPNPARPQSHWIRYDLNQIRSLGTTKFWNYNHPENLNRGFRNAVIDVSIDGINWTQAANFEIPQANGSGFYEGFDGPSLGGITGRYVLITGLSNHGGSCYGLGEVKIEVQNAVLAVNKIVMDLDCKNNRLDWTSFGEKNHDTYTVEFSNDGIIWQSSTEFKAKNQSTTQMAKYSHSITEEQNKAYYRLKLADVNGKISYSEIIKNPCSFIIPIEISPNPVINVVNIKMPGSGVWNILRQDGVRVQSFPAQSGENQYDLTSFPAGIYFMEFKDEQGFIHTEKIVKM